MPPRITERNQDDFALTAEAVRKMSHDVAAILGHVAHMRAKLDEFEPLIGQFKVSGFLAARRASRREPRQ